MNSNCTIEYNGFTAEISLNLEDSSGWSNGPIGSFKCVVRRSDNGGVYINYSDVNVSLEEAVGYFFPDIKRIADLSNNSPLVVDEKFTKPLDLR